MNWGSFAIREGSSAGKNGVRNIGSQSIRET